MRILISILLLSICFSDEYPFFSDIKKQLKFEEKRIYIEEVSERQMVVSGGAEFNFLYLLDSNQPVTIPAPVQTNYNYIYSFEIVQNGKMLSEIDMLKVVGLNDKADELTIQYEELVKEFKKILEHYDNS